jgi:hypothetical protein
MDATWPHVTVKICKTGKNSKGERKCMDGPCAGSCQFPSSVV